MSFEEVTLAGEELSNWEAGNSDRGKLAINWLINVKIIKTIDLSSIYTYI
jgi:hypothetical protein